MSPEVGDGDPAAPPPFAADEWEAIVAAAVAHVADIEAAVTQDDRTGAAVQDLLADQPVGARTGWSIPVPAGRCARTPTWHSRRYWLTLCEWIVTHTERGRDALTRHGIAAATFVRVCAAHADYAEHTTGRHISVSLGTLADRWNLSTDKLKRGRRVLKATELGVELARGKKLNATEREAAALLYTHTQGHAPARLQIGAASVWALSAPAWAVGAMPPPAKQPRRSRSHSPSIRGAAGSAPQSRRGSVAVDLSARKDHQTRERADEETSPSTVVRPLALQRAAAELVDRIPALRAVVEVDDATGHRRGHIGSVCDLLVDAGIDTERWTGSDIAQALNRDGTIRGWMWPTTEAMRSPLRLVAYRLSRLDWTGTSLTERRIQDKARPGESPSAAAYRLVRARRRVLADMATTRRPQASVEHRRALRTALAADLATKRAAKTAVIRPVSGQRADRHAATNRPAGWEWKGSYREVPASPVIAGGGVGAV